MLRLGCAVVATALMAAAPAGADAAFTARGSVEQVYVTGLEPGAEMSLLDRKSRVVQTRKANAEGGLLFRRVKPGEGYRVDPAGGGETSEPLTVLSKSSAPPDESIYDQEIQPAATSTWRRATGPSSRSTSIRRRMRRTSPGSRRRRPLPAGPCRP